VELQHCRQADVVEVLSWSWRSLQGQSVVSLSSSKCSRELGSVIWSGRDSVVFVPLLLDLSLLPGWSSRSFQTSCASTIGGIVWPSLHTFASPSECVSIRASFARRLRRPSMPTSPPVIVASSHGIRAASAADISHLASTPARPESLTSAAGYYTDNMFRPRGFSPPRRFTPRASCEFVAPHCQPKVRCVSDSIAHRHCRNSHHGAGPSTSPQRVSHPSKDSPHLQPYRVTTAVAFLTFHSLPCTTESASEESHSTAGDGALCLRRDFGIRASRGRSHHSHRPNRSVPASRPKPTSRSRHRHLRRDDTTNPSGP